MDASLKSVVLDRITELGAKGYNYVECSGKGQHAITGHPFSGDGLLRVEIITTMEIGGKILDYIHAAQFAQLGQYPLTAFADTVEVDMRDRSLAG